MPWGHPNTIEGHLREHRVPQEIIDSLSKKDRKRLHNYLHGREKYGGGSRYF